jgi:HPt (histidine-containing phosphotransfer) domain-containing protein
MAYTALLRPLGAPAQRIARGARLGTAPEAGENRETSGDPAAHPEPNGTLLGLSGDATDTRSRTAARVLVRALLVWLPGGALVLGALAPYDGTGEVLAQTARRVEEAAQLELAGRLLEARLSGARSDLQLLAASTTLRGYLRDSSAAPRAALMRDLFAFIATRPWCEGVRVVQVTGVTVLVERAPDEAACGTAQAHAVLRLPAGDPYLERVDQAAHEPPGTRLCLGLPVEVEAGGRAALLVETDAERLLGDLRGVAPGDAGPYVLDARGRWVLPPEQVGDRREPASQDQEVRGWQGPASGTWRLLTYPPLAEGSPGSNARRSRPVLLGFAFLAAFGVAARILGKTVEARRQAERRIREELDPFRLVSDYVPSPDYPAKPITAKGLCHTLERDGNARPGGSAAEGPPRPAKSEAGGIDPETLSRLQALEADGLPGFLAGLARDFDEGFAERFEEMEAAVRDGDAAALRSAAHNLKGSSGILGARGMADLCRDLEALGLEGRTEGAKGWLARLEREYEAVMSVLHESVTSLREHPEGETRYLSRGFRRGPGAPVG